MKEIKCCEYGSLGPIRTISFYLQLMNGPLKLVLPYTSQESLAMEKHSSLLNLFISYEGNEVLWIRIMRLNSHHFILFVTYKWTLKLELPYTFIYFICTNGPNKLVLHYTRLESLAGEKHSSLLGQAWGRFPFKRKWPRQNGMEWDDNRD